MMSFPGEMSIQGHLAESSKDYKSRGPKYGARSQNVTTGHFEELSNG